MPSIIKTLKVVADPNRLRILLLLKGEELSVAELQEILAMGQSTISTHLSQLKRAGLVEDRRTGKSNLYSLSATFWGATDYQSSGSSNSNFVVSKVPTTMSLYTSSSPVQAVDARDAAALLRSGLFR